jgi:membrane-associated phospholipid phosphatase
MLLSSSTYSNLIKDLTLLERPAIEGVVHPPGSYAFPSGHTLTAVTVWPYLAARLKKRGYWIWAAVAVVLIGFSRMVLGYHFWEISLAVLLLASLFTAFPVAERTAL